MMTTKIAVFDDSKDRRDSLKYLVEMHDDLELCGIFPNAKKAVENIKQSQPDIILMDIEMPGISGIDAVRKIKSEFPKVTILMQTVFDDDDLVFEAIEAGATGYLLKNTPPQKIIESIRDAEKGGAPMTPSIAMKVLKYFQQSQDRDSNDYNLTDREKDILKQLVSGNSYKMVAAELNISYHTVNSHVRRVYEKLHVHSLGEAVAKALKERLV